MGGRARMGPLPDFGDEWERRYEIVDYLRQREPWDYWDRLCLELEPPTRSMYVERTKQTRRGNYNCPGAGGRRSLGLRTLRRLYREDLRRQRHVLERLAFYRTLDARRAGRERMKAKLRRPVETRRSDERRTGWWSL